MDLRRQWRDMSNNEEELMVVCQGLKIAIRNGYNKLEVEGDSLMVIQALRKLNNGTSCDKVSRSWKTSSLIQELASILGRFDYLIIRHARREANKAADFLANWGCKELMEKMDNIWKTHVGDSRFEQLSMILNQDNLEDTIQRRI